MPRVPVGPRDDSSEPRRRAFVETPSYLKHAYIYFTAKVKPFGSGQWVSLNFDLLCHDQENSNRPTIDSGTTKASSAKTSAKT